MQPTASEAEPRAIEILIWQAALDVHSGVFTRLNRVISREFGITLAKFDVLAQLYRHPQGMAQGELSRHLKVTGGNITGLARRLCSDGLVTRQMSLEDRRVFIVQLTSAGKDRYIKARARHDTLLQEWFKNMSGDDKSESLRALSIMRRTLSQPRRVPGQ